MRAPYGSIAALSKEDRTKYYTEKHRHIYARNKEKIEADRKRRVKINLGSRFSYMISNAKERSKKLDKPIDIDKEYLEELWLKQNGLCALSGEQMVAGDTRSRTTSNMVSIDRVDNDKGYTKGNIQLVTAKVNYARGVMSIEEFKDLCYLIVEKDSEV